ncbi:uncharacterized protein VNE69_07301 [Vairimorpha necatrix]|uniref:Uncharacterized protein n=1 Tax=Vairimorpha necatrix TaxID=6039 RepID=A0AAX4JEN1_9MICR
MNLRIIFSLILLITASELLLNRIRSILIEKIFLEDYAQIDTRQVCDIEYINIKEECKFFSVEIFSNDNRINFPPLSKQYSIHDISRKIEEHIASYLELSPRSKLLVYNRKDFLLNKNIECIIKHIKEVNKNKKRNKNKYKNYYENIVDQKSHLYRASLNINKNYNLKNKKYVDEIYTVKKDNSLFINFFIQNNNLINLFEIDIEELKLETVFIKSLLRHLSHVVYDKKILESTLSLYKIYELNDVYKSLKISKMKFEYNSIEIIYYDFIDEKYIDLSIDVDLFENYITFKYMDQITVYTTGDFLFRNEATNKIQDSSFNELKLVITFFYNLRVRKFEEIEYFYLLITKNNLVESLVKKILTKDESGLNIFFKHLCVNLKLLSIDMLNDLDKYKINDIADRIKNVLIYADKQISYMVKVCLFYKVENIINENEYVEEQVYNRLKLIGDLIKEKEESNKSTTIKFLEKLFYMRQTPSFSIMKVFTEMFKEKNRFSSAIRQEWKNIYQTISLLKSLDDKIDKTHNENNLNVSEINNTRKILKSRLERTFD